MATDRFYFWRGYHKALSMLETDEQRGHLVMAMCDYAFDGIEPDLTDPMQRIVWAVVEDQIRESVEIGRKQSERGKRGGRPRKPEKKSGVKSTAKSTALSTAKSGVKSGVKSTAKSGAESEMNMNGSEYCAARTDADAPPLAQSDEAMDWYDENGVNPPVPAEQT